MSRVVRQKCRVVSVDLEARSAVISGDWGTLEVANLDDEQLRKLAAMRAEGGEQDIEFGWDGDAPDLTKRPLGWNVN